MSREKKLIKNTILFTIGNFGAKILNFILIPFYTFYLSTSELGKYDMIVTIISLLSPLVSLGLYDSAYRWLMDEGENKENVLSTTSIMFLCSLFLSSLIILTILFLTKNKYTISFTILLISNSIYVFLQFVTRGLKQNNLYVFQGIAYSIICFLFNMLIIVYLKWNYIGLLYAASLSNFMISFLLVYKLNIKTCLNIRYFSKEMSIKTIKYSVALIPNNISWWIVSSSDRFIVIYFLGISFNGIWAISTKFPSFIQLFTSFFYLSWQEQAIEEYDSKDRDSYYSNIFEYYYCFLLGITLVLIPVSKFVILNFMNSAYKVASNYVPLLLLGTVFSAFSSFYGTGYLSSKETNGAFFTTIIGAVINIIINIVFIKYIGLYAASISTMIAYLVIWICRIFTTKCFFNITLNFKKLLLLITLNVFNAFTIIIVNANVLIVLYSFICFMICLIFNKQMVLRIINYRK